MIGLNKFTGGSWGSHFAAHASQLHRVPKEISDECAILTDPLACALHGVLRYVPKPQDHVLVVGAGIIAMGVVGCLRALDCSAHLTVVVRHPWQADWMRRLGASDVIRFDRDCGRRERFDLLSRKIGGQRIDGRFGNYGFFGGFDVVYDCVGTAASLSDSFKLTRARGTTVLLGTSSIGLALDTTAVWSKELTVLGGYGRQIENYDGARMHTYELLWTLIQKGKINPAGMLTHTFRIGEYRNALAKMTARRKHAVVKAAFTFDQGESKTRT